MAYPRIMHVDTSIHCQMLQPNKQNQNHNLNWRLDEDQAQQWGDSAWNYSLEQRPTLLPAGLTQMGNRSQQSPFWLHV